MKTPARLHSVTSNRHIQGWYRRVQYLYQASPQTVTFYSSPAFGGSIWGLLFRRAGETTFIHIHSSIQYMQMGEGEGVIEEGSGGSGEERTWAFTRRHGLRFAGGRDNQRWNTRRKMNRQTAF